jgi:hypothetical protein
VGRGDGSAAAVAGAAARVCVCGAMSRADCVQIHATAMWSVHAQ